MTREEQDDGTSFTYDSLRTTPERGRQSRALEGGLDDPDGNLQYVLDWLDKNLCAEDA